MKKLRAIWCIICGKGLIYKMHFTKGTYFDASEGVTIIDSIFEGPVKRVNL